MKRFAFICTRDKNLKPVTQELLSYLDSLGTKVILLIGQKSIFDAYNTALNKIDAEPDDQVILCHDDIHIISSPDWFNRTLNKQLSRASTGFVGVAGARKLPSSAVWWDGLNQEYTKSELKDNLSGYVYHGTPDKCFPTYFGPLSEVEVLDGLFLASRYDTLKEVGLEKPSYFEGNWDFYDIHYTYKASKLGLFNVTAPIHLIHNSPGDLQGRDSWHKNREAFIKNSLTV